MHATQIDVSPRPKKRRNRASLSLPELIRMRMDHLRINQASVVRRSGLSASSVSRLLSGERIVLEDDCVQKLAKAIDVDWLDVIRAARNSRAMRREGKLQQAPSDSSET